jgi:hypothetical protein
VVTTSPDVDLVVQVSPVGSMMRVLFREDVYDAAIKVEKMELLVKQKSA